MANRQENFDIVMNQLAENKSDFFTGNVMSLLDLMSDIRQVEIRRKADNYFLSEEIIFKHSGLKVR